MATTPNWEQSNVANATERRDYADGWDRGYSGPYYPKEREAIVLANIAKISPAFVAGYHAGKSQGDLEDSLGQYDPDEEREYWKEQDRLLDFN